MDEDRKGGENTMEMMINSAVAASVQTTAAVSQGASKGQAGNTAAGFQQTLVHHIAGQSGGEEVADQQSSLVSAIAGLSALAGAESELPTPTLEELMAAIDGLIDSLGENAQDDETLSEQDLIELTGAMESLNALLALLGAPIVRLQPQAELQAGLAEETISNREAALNVKSSLQDALLGLQTKLQQGPLKQVQGQDPLAFVGEQLRVIASKLEGAKTKPLEQALTSETPEWLVTQQSGSNEALVHLQRMSRQTAHPAYIQAIAEQKALFTETLVQAEVGASSSESAQPVQLPFVGPDNVREFASLLTKSAAPTSFVLADDFAETMEGLIVQKFDIRALNGVTEAKLMLFPEHLGQVDVKISMQNGLLTALFQADNAMAKDMLENQMAQLRAALQAQGLNVEKLEVTQSSSAAQLSNQHFGNGQNGSGQSGDRQGFREDERVRDNAFETEMVEQAAIQGLGFGRSINEKA
ncbi:hypothetical protein B1748_26525 [Paenibacillus sp. MY03]|nr:hypothetical protein B1748_26525 [Paenibacillus sp. MY03]